MRIFIVLTDYEGEFIAAFTNEEDAEELASTESYYHVDKDFLYSSLEEYRERYAE